MERLHELVVELRQSLPQCYVCRKTAYETGVYLMYGCFHFLCLTCARTVDSLNHVECQSTPVELDYATLNQERDSMVTAAQAFFQGNTSSFPQIFTAYFRFIGTVAPFISPIQPVQPQDPGWTCPCGQINPSSVQHCSKCPVNPEPTWTCPCGRILPVSKRYCSHCKMYNVVPQVCEVCQTSPCSCSQFFGASIDVWECSNCNFGYNPNEEIKCVKCGMMMPGLE